MFGFQQESWGRWRGRQRKRGTDADARQVRGGGIPLCRVRPCQRCVIECMQDVEPSQARHLATLGVMPEAEVTVEQLAPFNGPVLLKVGGSRYALGREVAEQIMVRSE